MWLAARERAEGSDGLGLAKHVLGMVQSNRVAIPPTKLLQRLFVIYVYKNSFYIIGKREACMAKGAVYYCCIYTYSRTSQ